MIFRSDLLVSGSVIIDIHFLKWVETTINLVFGRNHTWNWNLPQQTTFNQHTYRIRWRQFFVVILYRGIHHQLICFLNFRQASKSRKSTLTYIDTYIYPRVLMHIYPTWPFASNPSSTLIFQTLNVWGICLDVPLTISKCRYVYKVDPYQL